MRRFSEKPVSPMLVDIARSNLMRTLLVVKQALEIERENIDRLNVFPVPDSDTGTNILLTLSSGVMEAQKLLQQKPEATVAELLDAFTRGVKLGARGNSGIILSHFVGAVCQELKTVRGRLTTKKLAQVLDVGNRVTRDNMTNIREGTMVSVFSAMASAAQEASIQKKPKMATLYAILRAAMDSVENSPKVLPELKGNSDAGGYGVVVMLKAVYDDRVSGMTDQSIEQQLAELSKQVAITLDEAWQEEMLRYELMVTISYGDGKFPRKKLEKYLCTVGGSVQITVIEDDRLAKVHVHTNKPDEVERWLEEMWGSGCLQDITIEDLKAQAYERFHGRQHKKLGVVAVASGDAAHSLLESLGIDEIVDGGQTANPSMADILNAINRVNADEVIVLPGNKNIVLTAAEAAKNTLVECSLVKTRNLAETLQAMMAFDLTMPLTDNVTRMSAAIHAIQVISVTQAARDYQSDDGSLVKEGEFIGIDADDNVILSHVNIFELVQKAINQLTTTANNPDLMLSIYAGADCPDEVRELQQTLDSVEVEVVETGQPVYHAILALG